MQLLWMWLPDEALVLVIVVVGLGVMLKLISLKSAGAALLGIAALILAGPFITALLDTLPWWVSAVIIAGAIIATVQGLMALLFGSRVTDRALGSMLAGFVRFVLLLPFRLIGDVLLRK